MATTTLGRGAGIPRGRWLTAGIILVIIVIVAALALNGSGRGSQAPQIATSPVTSGTIIATVSGSGTIAAAQSLDLGFSGNGTVAEVFVEEGDIVEAGQPLVQLDTRDLELQVASAQAALDSARMRLNQIKDGNIQQTDIDSQQAAVANAQAQLRSAQAKLAALKNPGADQLSTAVTNVRQAELDLQSARDTSSATKTKAEQDLQKAVDSLTQAQSKYATAKSNWDFVQETGQDPTNPETTDSTGKKTKNKVSDTQRQQYYDTFVQAEAALHSAEAGVEQARITYDNARQAEPNTIQQAEARLADAQAQLAALQNPGKNDLVQAQASVDQARASLAQAEANLAALTSPGGTESDVAIQQAAVTQAEQSLKQNQLQLEDATLKAPFAGIVTAVNSVAGGTAGSSTISLIDRSTLHIDLKLSENDIAKTQLNQKADLTIDALKDWQAQGTISYIAPAAETSNGVVTYAVRVSFPDSDPRVKVGMTANLSITTDQKENVLLVPNSALLPNGAGHAVQMLNADGTTREVDVQTGLTDGVNTEIVSGLKAGERVVTTPGIGTPTRNGPFGG